MNDEQEVIEEQPKNPDDISGIHIEGMIRISDPETGDVIVEGRS
jgi:hypothetical protein